MSYRKPEYFTNRELSWVDFNDRVLDEARDKRNPLLERVNFLGITQSNLDEFFMVRVASLRKMEAVNYDNHDAAGMLPAEQLKALSVKIHQQVLKQYSTLSRSLMPQLMEAGIELLDYENLSKRQLMYVSQYFHQDLYPVLTPMAVDSSRPFPFIGNNALYLAVRLAKNSLLLPEDDKKERRYALVQVPDVFNRIVQLPGDNQFLLLEEAIKSFIAELFTGYKVKEVRTLRVIRDMDFDVAQTDTSNLMKDIVSQLAMREHTKVMRLELEAKTGKNLRKWLTEQLDVREDDVYEINGPIDLHAMSQLAKAVTDHADLRYPPFHPFLPKTLQTDDLFTTISRGDVFLHHPYDSFKPMVSFIQQAAQDPDTLAIKMTLYRVSSRSPIIKALGEAAQNGKQVTVLVELKARFDEENNVHWAHELEKRGCHVIYGLKGLKTHCKLLLVVRRESAGIKRYVHMATGNYNDVTANFYTDMGLFTADTRIGVDASNIFNMLSGFSEPRRFEMLNIAPLTMRDFLGERIKDEIKAAQAGRPAKIRMKMNSLSDPRIIDQLYQASAAGVKIDIIVRGICCLKTGIKGVSDNITVHSIVGRFLEHSRIYYFYDDGQERLFLSSADMMNRNLSRRVELLFPVLQADIKAQIIQIYDWMWQDNLKTRVLMADGTYQKVDRRGLDPFEVQEALMAQANAARVHEVDQAVKQERTTFEPLRKPQDKFD